jgi:hypothetical protein
MSWRECGEGHILNNGCRSPETPCPSRMTQRVICTIWKRTIWKTMKTLIGLAWKKKATNKKSIIKEPMRRSMHERGS